MIITLTTMQDNDAQCNVSNRILRACYRVSREDKVISLNNKDLKLDF